MRAERRPVVEVRSRVERRQRDGAVHGTRVEIGEAEPPGDLARDRALPAPGGPVDRDDHRRKRRGWAWPARPLLALAVARAICACLGTVSAHFHRAPRGRPVAGVVVERPLARVVAAGLQALEGPVAHRRVDQAQDRPERTVEPLALGLERTVVVAEAHAHGHRGRHRVEARDGVAGRAARRCWPAAAPGGPRARRQSAPRRRRSPGPVLRSCSRQPGLQRRRRGDVVEVVVDVARVDELPDQLEPARCRCLEVTFSSHFVDYST